MSFNGNSDVFNRYRAVTLIPAYKLGFRGTDKYIAVPTKYLTRPVLVTYGNKETMYIKSGVQPVMEKVFNDKHRENETYALSYFKWEPEQVQTNFL